MTTARQAALVSGAARGIGLAAALARTEAVLGPLTTLVNHAGVGVMQRGDPLDITGASGDRCMAINARALFFLMQAFARRLIGRETPLFRAIVNVTSSNALAVAEPRVEYAVSKAAAAMASMAFAVRLAREGIAVYDVQPGPMATDLTAPVIDSYGARAEAGLTLIPGVGTADAFGTIIATLASGRLPYTTGQVIAADGAHAVPLLGQGDTAGFRATLDPSVPLAGLIFRAPTQYYKTGVVFLAWLNGFQDHFILLNGAQPMRPLPYFTKIFRLGDTCGLLRDPAALGRNTATPGHNSPGAGAGRPVERVIDACAARGIGHIVFWRREIGSRAVEIGNRVRAA